MRIQVIHHKHNFCGVRVPFVQHLFDIMRPVIARSMFRNSDVSSSSKRFYFKQNFRYAVAHIFIINQHWVTRCHRNWLGHFSDELLA